MAVRSSRLAALCLFSVATIACSSAPSNAEQTAVRAAVVTWFGAAKRGDTAAASAVMSSSCTASDIQGLALFAPLAKDVELLGVDVKEVDADKASATINLTTSAVGGGGPQPVNLTREGGTWKVACDT